MSDTAIKVENLSKRYRIGLREEMHDTFADALTENEHPPHPQPTPAPQTHGENKNADHPDY